MSMVAKYGAALAGSALMTALGFGLVAGASIDLLFQPHYWVVTLSLAAFFGLTMGKGIGSEERRADGLRMADKGSIAIAA